MASKPFSAKRRLTEAVMAVSLASSIWALNDFLRGAVVLVIRAF
jgi:hypothetical protein